MIRNWTFEKLQEEALKFKTRSEFQKNSKTAYNTAQRRGVLNLICLHMEALNVKGDKNPNFKWAFEKLQEEALKFKTRSEFKEKSPKAYQAAWYNDILDKICSHMEYICYPWTNAELAEEALKHKTRSEFQKNNDNAYQVAHKRGILDKICSHMEYICYPWTNEELAEEALKFATRSEFQKNNNAAYLAAHKRDIFEQISQHMKSCKWSDEQLAEEALKHKTRSEFQKNNNGAYSTAQHRGLLDKILTHAPKIKGTSLVQKDIANFIKSFYPNTVEESHKIIPPLELDIYIPELKLAIEYTGLYWHSEEYKNKNYHYNKMKMCNEKGIRLITIFEDEWLERQDQVKNFLLSVLNKNTVKLMARKTKIQEVSKQDAISFLEQHHIQGAPTIEKAYGLYYNNELQAVITGNKHHRQGFDDTFVLNRLAFKSGVSISGGSSKLLKTLIGCTKEQGYSRLISWSDNRWSEGNVYEKLGFQLTESSSPDYSYVQKQRRISKQSCQKKSLLKKGGIGTTEREMALSLGLYRIWDCGKKRWEINL